MESSLGSTLEDLFLSFESRPLASGSIAQVHRARLLVDGRPHEVAVKVRRQGPATQGRQHALGTPVCAQKPGGLLDQGAPDTWARAMLPAIPAARPACVHACPACPTALRRPPVQVRHPGVAERIWQDFQLLRPLAALTRRIRSLRVSDEQEAISHMRAALQPGPSGFWSTAWPQQSTPCMPRLRGPLASAYLSAVSPAQHHTSSDVLPGQLHILHVPLTSEHSESTRPAPRPPRLPPRSQSLNLSDSVAQFSHTMTAQADLRVEAQHLRRFHANFCGATSSVHVPRPLEGELPRGAAPRGQAETAGGPGSRSGGPNEAALQIATVTLVATIQPPCICQRRRDTAPSLPILECLPRHQAMPLRLPQATAPARCS